MHRAIDMTLFLAKTLCDSGSRAIRIAENTFPNQNDELVISKEDRSRGENQRYESYLAQNEEHLKQRLRVLADILTELRQSGKL